MAAPAPMPSPKSKPDAALIIESEVSFGEETIGIDIPLLAIHFGAIEPDSTDRMRVSLPSGRVSLVIDIFFRAFDDRVSVVADLIADSVQSINIKQKAIDYVEINVKHRFRTGSATYESVDENCTLECAKGRPISASGHCIDCAGPRGKVRLCC